MRRTLAIVIALLFGGAMANSSVGQTGPAAARESVPLFPSRHNLFDIPFQIDEPLPGQEPVEVQLHVSENSGVTWHLAAKVAPDAGRFSFRAAHDGEFWFLVRTLNKQGRLLPEKPFAPEMRVLVDTEPPTIELKCDRTPGGAVECRWKLNDSALQPDSVALSYQGVDSGLRWQPIAATPPKASGDGAWNGQTSFTPAGVKSPVFVRLEASDAAGNRAVAQTQIDTPAGAGPTALPSTTAERTPWTASKLPPLDSKPLATAGPPTESIGPGTPAPKSSMRNAGDPTQTSPPAMTEHFPGREAVPTPSGRATPSTPYQTTSEPKSAEGGAAAKPAPVDVELLPTPPSNDTVSPTPPTQRTLLPELNRNAPEMKLPDAGPAPLALPKSPASATPPTGPTLNGLGDTAPTPTPLPAQASKSASEGPLSLPAASESALPAGVTPRWVNSRRFELEYDVESIGSAGVAKIELWATRDGGRTWAQAGVDPDGTSPYLVNVADEGVYGFRIVIETTTGLRTPTPAAGELPDVWLGIDVTKPTAKLTEVRQGTGELSGELILRWEARDERLAARPVSFAFAEQADGPWTTIAAGIAAEADHYAWRFDARTPDRLYVKLEVRDTAGNTTAYVTPEPVKIERVRPTGRIRSVRPLGESARLRVPSQIAPR